LSNTALVCFISLPCSCWGSSSAIERALHQPVLLVLLAGVG